MWISMFYVEIVCPVANVSNARLITVNVTSPYLPYMSTIEYECLPGFVLLSGVLINQCLESGNWTNLPTCTSNETIYFFKKATFQISRSWFLRFRFQFLFVRSKTLTPRSLPSTIWTDITPWTTCHSLVRQGTVTCRAI